MEGRGQSDRHGIGRHWARQPSFGCVWRAAEQRSSWHALPRGTGDSNDSSQHWRPQRAAARQAASLSCKLAIKLATNPISSASHLRTGGRSWNSRMSARMLQITLQQSRDGTAPPVDDAKGCSSSGGGGMQLTPKMQLTPTTRTPSVREIAHCYGRSRPSPLETACQCELVSVSCRFNGSECGSAESDAAREVGKQAERRRCQGIILQSSMAATLLLHRLCFKPSQAGCRAEKRTLQLAGLLSCRRHSGSGLDKVVYSPSRPPASSAPHTGNWVGTTKRWRHTPHMIAAGGVGQGCMEGWVGGSRGRGAGLTACECPGPAHCGRIWSDACMHCMRSGACAGACVQACLDASGN